ncbi:hypothetical protein H4R34_003795 [Dimargaris verticillata]|uniref:Uncharacterized protein n=1 Tax=Dimargaris verticillata TaxID=2761393 RepID=A0A9W8B021_9FUNG|nr:hypothetical protein H4R34_003795 [Dimargaris verticillata]
MRLSVCISIVCLLGSTLVLADENSGNPGDSGAATNSANVQVTPAPECAAADGCPASTPSECKDQCSQAAPAPKPTDSGKASKDHINDSDSVDDDDDESNSKKNGNSSKHGSGSSANDEEPSPTEPGSHHKHHSKGHHKHSKTSSSHPTDHIDASGSEDEGMSKTHRDVSTVRSYDRLEDLFNAGARYGASMQVTVAGLVLASLAAGYWH